VDLPAQKKAKPPRSHWDMLLERRTIADLEEVLAERLAVIRERRGLDAGDATTAQTPAVQRKSA
jgi:hypothetical protein